MKEIMEWVKDILLAVVIAAVILAFFKPIIVQQQSMEPNFHAGDYLITSRQAYRLFGDPQRGDVIVFKSELLDENEKPKNLIKRSDLRRNGRGHRTGGTALCNGRQPRMQRGQPFAAGWHHRTVDHRRQGHRQTLSIQHHQDIQGRGLRIITDRKTSQNAR